MVRPGLTNGSEDDNLLRGRHAQVVCDSLRVSSIVVHPEAEGEHMSEEHSLGLRGHFESARECAVDR